MAAQLLPRLVAERLDAELGNLRLVYGQADNRKLPEGFWASSPHLTAGELVEHLLTLSWGLPLAKELQALAWGLELAEQAESPSFPRWYGRTDFRGQFWVRALQPGEYVLRYVPWPKTLLD